jgi:hypothetical protein
MLEQLDDKLWSASSIQAMPGGVKLPARMIVVGLDDGLWVHSPIAIDDALAAELDALGPVRHLVAPNCFHHLHLGPASERWPDARVYAPTGLRAKRPDLRIDEELSEDARPWGEAIEVVRIAGAPKMEEFVFVDRGSRTLLLCDLMFNVHESPGVMGKLVLRIMGTWGRLNQSRLWRKLTEDRAAARRSCERLLELEFARVVVSHGRVEEGGDVRERVREGLAWMLAQG